VDGGGGEVDLEIVLEREVNSIDFSNDVWNVFSEDLLG